MSNLANSLRPNALIASVEAARATDKLYAVGAVMLGAFLIFGVGFANAELLHNVAHDGRHSFVFPCH